MLPYLTIYTLQQMLGAFLGVRLRRLLNLGTYVKGLTLVWDSLRALICFGSCKVCLNQHPRLCRLCEARKQERAGELYDREARLGFQAKTAAQEHEGLLPHRRRI